ncbi:MAG TPA: alpha/beta family hydrolase, partial [Reyranella sp.]
DSDAGGTLGARLRDCRPGLFDEWIDVPLAPDIDSRLAQLDALVPHGEAARRIVLLGRSAGARVVSTFAMCRTVGAVICLSYPFRMPNRRLEPARFAHLAELAVPTLIVQGCRDEYGGLDITEHYAFSPSVSLRFIDGDHALAQSPDRLERAAPLMRSFCDATSNGQAFPPARFDEAFYRRTHARAANEIAAGRYRSAEQHYDEIGRQERLAFRLLPEPG